MKRGIILLLILSAISGVLLWYFWCDGVRKDQAQQQQQDDNDPCVRKAFKALAHNLPLDLEQASLEDRDSAKIHIDIVKTVKKFDLFRKQSHGACGGNHLPYKIVNGVFTPPDKGPNNGPPNQPSFCGSPSPNPTPTPSPTPYPPPPQRVSDNTSAILDFAKSVGRLGIRRTGSQSDPLFWGTGFLVASSKPP